MSLYDEMQSNMPEVFDDIAIAVTLGDSQYSALVSENPVDAKMEAAGIRENQTVTVKFNRSDLTDETMPAIKSLIVINGERLRVSKVIDRPPHPLIIVEATR
jgi:hypothetical protein